MKITTKKHSKKKTIIFSAIVILLIMGIGGTLYLLTQNTSTSHHDTTTSSNTDKKTKASANTQTDTKEAEHNATQKKEYVTEQLEKEKSEPADSSTTASPSQPTSDTISLSAERAGDSVTVYTRLAPISSGTCTLTVTNNGKTTSQTAEIIYQSQHSLCAGFSVPVGPLGTGIWNIQLSVQADSDPAQKSITYEVK